MSTVFPGPQPVTIPVRSLDQHYPVNRIFFVGRNYEAHAREMGNEVDREAPFYFTKSAQAITLSGSSIPYPPGTSDFHHEVELVVALSEEAFEIDAQEALGCIYGYACGLDMTRRDLQAKAKDKRRPWDLGKDFEHSAVISHILPASEIGHPSAGRIHLEVNGEARQEGDLSDLVWPVPDLIADLSKFYHLVPGDLIYTGTPSGVGPIVAGDKLSGGIEGVANITLEISTS